MHWFLRIARSEKERIEENIRRLEHLRSVVHDLGYFTVASNSGGFQVLNELIEDNLVRGRDKVYAKLKSAIIGENNQKIALDAPTRFQGIMRESEQLIEREIGKEKRILRKLETNLENLQDGTNSEAR